MDHLIWKPGVHYGSHLWWGKHAEQGTGTDDESPAQPWSHIRWECTWTESPFLPAPSGSASSSSALSQGRASASRPFLSWPQPGFIPSLVLYSVILQNLMQNILLSLRTDRIFIWIFISVQRKRGRQLSPMEANKKISAQEFWKRKPV